MKTHHIKPSFEFEGRTITSSYSTCGHYLAANYGRTGQMNQKKRSSEDWTKVTCERCLKRRPNNTGA